VEEMNLYKTVCDNRFCKIENKIDKLDDKFDKVNDKFDKLYSKIDKNHLMLLDRIQPLTNFKYRIVGVVSVLTILISVFVSYSIVYIRSKPQNTIKHVNYNL